MFVSLPFCMFASSSVCQFVRLPVCLFASLFVRQFVCLTIFQFVSFLFICFCFEIVFARLSVCLLSVCFEIFLSVSLFVCLYFVGQECILLSALRFSSYKILLRHEIRFESGNVRECLKKLFLFCRYNNNNNNNKSAKLFLNTSNS